MSSRISPEVKAQVDTLARRHGISRARLIEEALQFHLPWISVTGVRASAGCF